MEAVPQGPRPPERNTPKPKPESKQKPAPKEKEVTPKPTEAGDKSQTEKEQSQKAEKPEQTVQDKKKIDQVEQALDMQIDAQIKKVSGNEQVSQFKALRDKVQQQVGEDLRERIAANPNLVGKEKILKRHIEAFEPQVRDAVMKLAKKGYEIESAGFDPKNPDFQRMSAKMELSGKIKNKLRGLGISVDQQSDQTYFSFATTEDPESMKKQWDAIAEIVPKDRKILKNIAMLLAAIGISVFQETSGEMGNSLTPQQR